jgi:hypothetical protein
MSCERISEKLYWTVFDVILQEYFLVNNSHLITFWLIIYLIVYYALYLKAKYYVYCWPWHTFKVTIGHWPNFRRIMLYILSNNGAMHFWMEFPYHKAKFQYGYSWPWLLSYHGNLVTCNFFIVSLTANLMLLYVCSSVSFQRYNKNWMDKGIIKKYYPSGSYAFCWEN